MSIKVDSVAKSFADVEVLRDISLEVEANEIVSIIGPSGCGKSTLLRMIAGLEEADSGTIDISSELCEHRSFVFQDPLLLDWRRLEENILLPTELGKNISGNDSHWLDEVLKMTGLCEHRKKYPHELSGGMRMRTSLARALINKPKLMFLDEPFGALDEMTRERLNLDIRRIHQKAPCTILLVTHNLAEAVFMSDRILVMGSEAGAFSAEIEIQSSEIRDENFVSSELFNQKLCNVRKALREVES